MKYLRHYAATYIIDDPPPKKQNKKTTTPVLNISFHKHQHLKAYISFGPEDVLPYREEGLDGTGVPSRKG